MLVDRSTPDAVLRALARRPLLFDGAMGSTLNDLPERDWEAPEEATLRFPDRMAEVYQAYLDAGADVLSTNTFGGNLIRLERAGLTEKSEAINRGAAEQARAVAGDDAWVAGDIGQSGDFLEPLGDVTEARMTEAFRVQAEQLAEGGVDLLLCETFSDIREVQIAIDAASSTGLPVFATMTYDINLHTMMGVAPADGLRACEEAGAAVVGCNCGNGPEEMTQVLDQMLAAGPRRPLMAQSNAGVPELIDGRVCYLYPPEKMVEFARQWIESGVSVIGSCCGSTNQTTFLLREMIDRLPATALA
ncbi:MAG: homocysteine S-methyltransferase family protein [Chloroflexota bacterium]|nr:homocysteine S-methyltransferase family protein [Chloroflexota bacterium]MDE2899344.1 homocysteine S-methyltransferase family protein [Chloroflexota bacterium]